MLGLYSIESGQILINGYPMNEYKTSDVLGMFTVLYQNYVKYPLSLRDSVALSDISRFDDSKSIESAFCLSDFGTSFRPESKTTIIVSNTL